MVVPALGVGLIAGAFVVNLLGNKVIGGVSKATAAAKILGIAAFAAVGLWVSGLSFEPVASGSDPDSGAVGFLAAVALSILAYKGFTTITNSGDEITERRRMSADRSSSRWASAC